MAGDVQLIVNTPYGVGPRVDGYEIRTAAVIKGVPCITTVQGLAAAVQGIESLQHDEPTVRSLQEHALFFPAVIPALFLDRLYGIGALQHAQPPAIL